MPYDSIEWKPPEPCPSSLVTPPDDGLSKIQGSFEWFAQRRLARYHVRRSNASWSSRWPRDLNATNASRARSWELAVTFSCAQVSIWSWAYFSNGCSAEKAIASTGCDRSLAFSEAWKPWKRPLIATLGGYLCQFILSNVELRTYTWFSLLRWHHILKGAALHMHKLCGLACRDDRFHVQSSHVSLIDTKYFPICYRMNFANEITIRLEVVLFNCFQGCKQRNPENLKWNGCTVWRPLDKSV